VISGLYSILEMMDSFVLLLYIVTTKFELLEDVLLLLRCKCGNSRRQIRTAKSSLTHLKAQIYLFRQFLVQKKGARNLNSLEEAGFFC
jgi:hypothetical protein